MRAFLVPVMACLLAFSTPLFSQTDFSPTNPWAFTSETALKANTKKQQKRQIIPQKYRTLHLDVAKMKSILAEAPLWHTEASEKKAVNLTLPMPDGSFQLFRIEESPVMHPDLGKKYPTIKTYSGTSLDDPYAYARLDFTPRGFHAMIRGGEKGDVFIDPYSKADIENYSVYYKRDFVKDSPWQCMFDEVNKGAGKVPLQPFTKAGDCKLRTYTLALACTGEYATFHDGVMDSVLAAMTTTMNRVNGVFIVDASVFMVLHPNTDTLVFFNASTDPYTNSNGSTMLGQNQTTCDNRIGNANYDIGHVFSTGGGGVAYLGCVCNSSNKAGGVTGQSSPVGDAFDIDYVAHEMGHQFGANHTQNNNCNRNSATAMEPGSASTIMGYAGICAPNIQPHSDDYFHAISIQEIAAEVTNGTNGGSGSGGNVCSTNTTVNNTPTANAGSDYTIPKSTPFVLTGTGTDPDGGQVLKYCWEQMDNAVATMPPNQNNTGGPTFRSWKQTTSPSRYFPKLDSLVANDPMTWEVLPAVGRTLNFRLTVRDNFAGGGCTAEDNMVVTVNGTAGPFVVTAPNTAVNWPALSQQTVTWNVAGTTAAPVNCANVDILLSTDGGFTYPITLATATTNDGSHVVTLPSNTSTTARIMVKGAGNIFFDISDANFTISTPANNFTFDVTPNSVSVCQPANAVYTVNVGATGSFSGTVTLSTSGLPSGASASFSANSVNVPPTASSTLTISGLGSVAVGTYNFTVSGDGSTGIQSETVTLIVGNTPAQATLATPANGATGVSQTPTLTWNAVPAAATYDVQVATDAGFSNLVVNATGVVGTSYNVTTQLAANTLHHWRVRAINPCGTGAYSSTFTFTTSSVTCTTFASSDVPKSISASGTPVVTSTLTIAPAGTITDVNVTNLNITHTYISDLRVKLKNPANTERILVNQICGTNDNMAINFDDESSNTYASIPCPPTNNGTYQPNQTLSPFDGQAVNGTWTLTIEDLANQDGGTLNSWSLNVCYTPANPPVSVTITSTNVSCNGGNNGSATANPSGGNGSYTYLWSNNATTQTISNLTTGTYTVTVTSNGNTATASTTITQPPVLTVTVTGTNPSGGNNNGSATATPSGGTPSYTYLWSNGGTTQTINNLGAGTYTVTTTDANGCTATGSVTLVQGDPPVSVTITSVNVSCNGGNNGSATANPSGGNGTYTYAWSNGPITQTINNLTAGTYTVTVTSNGNTATASTTITQPSVLTVTVSGNNPSSGNNGSATANPAGGTPGYSYLWSTGGTTQTINNLGAGTYIVTVTDTKGCTASGSVTLTAPPALKFENGTLSGVGDSWVTVNLSNSYTSMVVVATVIQPNSSSNTPALVTRVQNASGTSFQVRVQKAKYSGTTTAATVHWIVAEEGTYTTAANGVKFEAKKYTSTTTSRANNWVLNARTYSNSYTTPVVVGQVMSFNDANWSVFWASRSNNATNPPNSTSFACGKHIAEDNVNTTRANETIGYMVFESGTGVINGKTYRAALGTDIVQGTSNNASGYAYTISGMTNVESAVVSSAAMDGAEGAWGVMAAVPTSTTLRTWALEDDILDTERSHTTEQMAWFVIGTGTAFGGGGSEEQWAVGSEQLAVGSVSPSEPVPTAREVGGAATLFAYPNPAKTQLTVEFEQRETTAHLFVLDVLGKVVLTKSLEGDAGYQQATLDVSNLQPGYYFLQLRDGKERRTVAFVRE